MKIALFGTSADPPTAGHQAILRWLANHFDHVAVWAADNPMKAHQTPLAHRAAMLQLLIDDLWTMASFPGNVQLYRDLSHPKTLVTIEQARQRWPEAELTLIVGSDLVTQLPRWYRVQDLLQQVKLLIIPRPGHALQESSLMGLKQLGANFAIAGTGIWPSPPAVDVSSTAYRQNGDPEVLPPPVTDYIQKEKLYA